MNVEMDEEEEIIAVVIDIGSGWSKVGFAGDDLPRSIFPSTIGKPRNIYPDKIIIGMRQVDTLIGDEARNYYKSMYKIDSIVKRGITTNWDDMERFWHHAFYNKLRIRTEEHPVLLTEPVLNPKANRERMTQIMFESFDVPLLYIASQPVLSLHAAGRNTGVVLESGAGVTHSVPIYAGHYVPHGVTQLCLAGRDLTSYLIKLLYKKGYSFIKDYEIDLVNDIKEKYCYVALDGAEEEFQYLGNSIHIGDQEYYEFPDGNVITLGDEIFRCPEALFDPSLVIGDRFMDNNGIHLMVFASIMSTSAAIRHDLYANIVLGGGSTLFKGIGDRLKKEITALAEPNFKVNVISPPERKYSAWVGGSILASHSASTSKYFNYMWMTKDEYWDRGPTIVHHRLKTPIIPIE